MASLDAVSSARMSARGPQTRRACHNARVNERQRDLFLYQWARRRAPGAFASRSAAP
jgi:hypothetical protein